MTKCCFCGIAEVLKGKVYCSEKCKKEAQNQNKELRKASKEFKERLTLFFMKVIELHGSDCVILIKLSDGNPVLLGVGSNRSDLKFVIDKVDFQYIQ